MRFWLLTPVGMWHPLWAAFSPLGMLQEITLLITKVLNAYGAGSGVQPHLCWVVGKRVAWPRAEEDGNSLL